MLERVAAGDRGTFASVHWGRTPLLSRAGELPGGFSDLFSAAAVDELVSERGLRTPFLRMAKDGSVISAAKFTRGGGAGAGAGDQVADDKVAGLLDDGATLVLQGLHRTWPPLLRFGNELSAELGHPVQINAYITPPQNRGFAAHYDVHDVFVLQIQGTKQWRVHEPVFPDPLPDQDWEQRRDEVAARAAQPPIIDTVLAPGDALYLPRGYLHSAEALGDFSIHLTVGVHPLTRARLVRSVLDATRDDLQLRRSLPMGVDLGDPSVLAGEFAATIDALRARLEEVSVVSAAAEIATQLREQTRPEPMAPLAALAAAAALTATTPLRLRRGVRVALDSDDEAVTVRLIDTSVRYPLAAAAALKAVLDGGPFTPADLPGLDAAEQLALGRRLLREGIVVAV